MKIAHFLYQYLIQNGELDFPTIGKFTLGQERGDVNQREITFSRQDISKKFSPHFIDFIAKQTGKIPPLANSDAQSLLDDMHQFLNIGNPYYLEGIGTIYRNWAHEYEFTPDYEKRIEKPKATIIKDVKSNSVKESHTSIDDDFYGQKPKTEVHWQRILSLVLLIILIGVGIWGAITLFKKYKKDKIEASNPVPIPQPKDEQATVVKDTITAQQGDTSLNKTRPDLSANVPETGIKYVLEIADSLRAVTRTAKLKSYGWDVKVQQNQAGQYVLYVNINRPVTDSTRIVDSLARLTGRKVSILTK